MAYNVGWFLEESGLCQIESTGYLDKIFCTLVKAINNLCQNFVPDIQPHESSGAVTVTTDLLRILRKGLLGLGTWGLHEAEHMEQNYFKESCTST